MTKTRIHLVNTRPLISILRELIQKQNGKRHRQHSSAYIPIELILAAKRHRAALQIFQNRAEKLLGPVDATHKHPHGNVTQYRDGLITFNVFKDVAFFLAKLTLP